MKKARTILLLLFALFFFSKNLSASVFDPSRSMCYVIDLEENDPGEKSGKNSPDEKEKNEDWFISTSVPTVQGTISNYSFCYYKETGFLTPYFEISPRPPQLNF